MRKRYKHSEETKQKIRKAHIKHGMTKTKIYRCWQKMKERCLDKKGKDYKYYGSRKIIICDRWLGKNGFENFYKDMGDKQKNKSLDRVNNNGNYEPSNCKWSSPKQQNNNKRNNRLITYQGKTQNMKQWAEELEIKYTTLQGRIKRGWNDERALNLIS